MFTALWVTGACLSLAVLVLAVFRDRGRFGVTYCVETAAAWSLLLAVAYIKQLIRPFPMEPWQVSAGAVAIYGCTLLVSAGRPAMLTAPYSEHARTRLSALELRHWHRMAWVLTGVVATAAITISVAVA